MISGPADNNELPLDQAIQQQLAKEVLDAGQLQQLLAMQQAVLDDREGGSGRGRWRRWAARDGDDEDDRQGQGGGNRPDDPPAGALSERSSTDAAPVVVVE